MMLLATRLLLLLLFSAGGSVVSAVGITSSRGFNEYLATQAQGAIGQNLAASSTNEDSFPTEASLIVNNKNISVHGLTFPSLNQSQFLGIPFGQPPVGDLRFKAPLAVDYDNDNNDTSSGIDATQYGRSCSQPLRDDTSEDCLTLNVFTPSAQAIASLQKSAASLGSNGSSLTDAYKNGLPVLVWIYGGE